MAKSGGVGAWHQQASIAGIVAMRLFLGAFFIYASIMHFAGHHAFVHYLSTAVAPSGVYVQGNLWPTFSHFLVTTIAPHADLTGWLITVAEGLIGVLFVFGLLTRLAGIIALLISASFLLATLHLSAADIGLGAGTIAGAFVLMELVVTVAAAGRTWGLDSLIARRTRVRLLW